MTNFESATARNDAPKYAALLARATAYELLLDALWSEEFRDEAIADAFAGQPAEVCDAAEALISELSEDGRAPNDLSEAILVAFGATPARH
jgi:hypothetical protein